MKILIVTGIFEPELGGPAGYSAALSRELSARGHEVAVLTYADRGSEIGKYPFRVRRVFRSLFKPLNYLKFLAASLSEIGAHDAVYCLDQVAAGFPLALAASVLRKPYAVRVGGGYIWEKYLSDGNPPMTLRSFYEKGISKKYRLLFRMIRMVLRRAAAVVFNSKEQAEIFSASYGLSSDKVSVIPNPVPPFDPVARGAGQSSREIVFAGRFIKMKNPESLLEAFAVMGVPEARLVMIGEGPLASALRSKAESLGIADRVSFEKPKPRRELYERISSCRFVVLPSWTDISPNQFVECLRYGIPVLITRENFLPFPLGDLPTVDPGSVEDIARKMRSLFEPEKYNEFSERFGAISYSYEWRDAASDHMALFDKLIY